MSADSQRSGGMGARGTCICVGCGHREPHRPGSPCREQRCPQCGKAMLREGSVHHAAYLEKKAKQRAPSH
jgi:NAD-dependent SIR2 family protein deacetylase